MHHHCPDEELLAAWFDGLLAPEARDALCAELVACPRCSGLLASLGMVIETETAPDFAQTRVPTAVTRRAMDLWPALGLRLAVRWVRDRLVPLADALVPLPSAAVAVRGVQDHETHEELHYQVRVGELDLAIALEVDGPELVALWVRPVAAPPPGLLLRLTTDGETRAVSSLTTAGSTVFALPLGAYELSLEQAGRALGSLDLSLS